MSFTIVNPTKSHVSGTTYFSASPYFGSDSPLTVLWVQIWDNSFFTANSLSPTPLLHSVGGTSNGSWDLLGQAPLGCSVWHLRADPFHTTDSLEAELVAGEVYNVGISDYDTHVEGVFIYFDGELGTFSLDGFLEYLSSSGGYQDFVDPPVAGRIHHGIIVGNKGSFDPFSFVQPPALTVLGGSSDRVQTAVYGRDGADLALGSVSPTSLYNYGPADSRIFFISLTIDRVGGVEPQLSRFRLYADFQQDISPTWMTDNAWATWLETLGTSKDQFLDRLVDAVTLRTATYADEQGLAYIGQERMLDRYPTESVERYRQRVLKAWSFWEFAGTNQGIRRALFEAGYVSSIILHRFDSDSRWSEFSVLVYPITPVATIWGSFNWNETTWNSSSTAIPLSSLRELILKVKSAQGKLVDVLYSPFGQIFWNSFNWNSGDWGEVVQPL